MINKPLISIIMPMYNAELYIEEAIRSCLNQTYQNIEILVVDDGSKDDSIKIVERISEQDARVKLFFTPYNQGPAMARNIGLENSSGEYITFLDSDDFIESNKLEKQIAFMLENNVSMTHGNYSFCDLDGNKIKSITTSKKINYKILLRSNQFKIMTVLIKKEAISNLRFPKIKHEDYAFFLDCLKCIEYSYLYDDGFDSNVRIGKVSVSSNKIKSAMWTFRLYFLQEKLGLLKSLYYFCHYAYNALLKHKR